MPLQLQLSGACAATLMLGCTGRAGTAIVALLGGVIAPAEWDALVAQAVWQGVVPASLALAAGALLRRLAGPHPFVYILGRAFAATMLCTFLAEYLSQLAGHEILNVGMGLSMVARWLASLGRWFHDRAAAIFVAYRPQ